DNRRLDPRGLRGWGDVDRLLEERAVHRVRLVENRERPEAAGSHQPFDRELPAFDEPFDDHRIVEVAAPATDVWRLEQRAKPVERSDQRRLIVNADHAATAGQRDRLDDAWE